MTLTGQKKSHRLQLQPLKQWHGCDTIPMVLANKFFINTEHIVFFHVLDKNKVISTIAFILFFYDQKLQIFEKNDPNAFGAGSLVSEKKK